MENNTTLFSSMTMDDLLPWTSPKQRMKLFKVSKIMFHALKLLGEIQKHYALTEGKNLSTKTFGTGVQNRELNFKPQLPIHHHKMESPNASTEHW